MNSEEIYNNLSLLNDKLKDRELKGEIFLYGGAVMCLCFKSRYSTHDIDAVFAPKSEIIDIVNEISEEEGLDKNWLNDAIKGFLSEKNDIELYDKMSNLSIYTAKAEYLLAMKLMSCRMEESSNDLDDIKFLLKYLKIKDINKAEEILLSYFPPKLIQLKTGFLLEELFCEDL